MSTNTLSRLPRNGKNNPTHKSYPLTEENLKLHTTMMPPSRETKTHLVLIYVDLQKQLVALEAKLKKEAEEAQKKFNASLPENTPSVIPEVIHVSQLSNSSQNISPTIDGEEPTVACLNELEHSSSRSIEVPSLFDSVKTKRRKSQRIKNIFKKTAKKLTSIIGKSTENDNENNSLTPPFDRASRTSLNVELSVPPSPSQSTLRSRNSSSRPKAPFTHNRTNSADTTHTLSIHPISSVQNSSAQNSPLLPPPLTPNTNISSNLNSSSPPSPNDEKYENDVCQIAPEHRDSGISLVPRPGHHSREHSISSILRKVGLQKDNQRHSREKSWGPFSSVIAGSKDNEMPLLAFRYPSIHNSDFYIDSSGMEDQDNNSCSGGVFVSEFDGTSGKQKDKERSVTFDLNDQQTLDEETGLNKGKRCSAINNQLLFPTS